MGIDLDGQSYTSHFSTKWIFQPSVFGAPGGVVTCWCSAFVWLRIVGASVHLIADPVLLQPYLQELLPLLEVRGAAITVRSVRFARLGIDDEGM